MRARYAATGDGAVLAGVPEEDREFVTGVWPPEFERILRRPVVAGMEMV